MAFACSECRDTHARRPSTACLTENSMRNLLLAVLMVAACFVAAEEGAKPGGDPLAAILVPGEEWQVAVEGLGFADGLSYDSAGNVYFGDLRGPNAGVYKLAADGTKTKLADGGRSGTRLGPDGRLYACGGKTLVAIDPEKVTPIAENIGTNDLAVTFNGRVYVTSALGLQVFEPSGKLLGVMAKRGSGPLVSAGFGGKDLNYLYLANGEKIYRRKLSAHGARPPVDIR